MSVEPSPQTFGQAWLYLKGDIVHIDLHTDYRYVGVVTRCDGMDAVYARVWVGGRLSVGEIRFLAKWVSVIGRIDGEEE